MTASVIRTIRIGTSSFAVETNERPDERVDCVEFLIDDQPLSALLGIARSLANSDCDLHAAHRETGISRFLGHSEPANQFGSGRLVLYRCHCGSDYCGVVSCRLNIGDEIVVWRDIGIENDGSLPPSDDASARHRNLATFAFDARQYTAEFERHRNA